MERQPRVREPGQVGRGVRVSQRGAAAAGAAHLCLRGMRDGVPAVVAGARIEIEQLLRPRPLANQNWIVGETLEHLLAENIEHGLAPEGVAA